MEPPAPAPILGPGTLYDMPIAKLRALRDLNTENIRISGDAMAQALNSSDGRSQGMTWQQHNQRCEDLLTEQLFIREELERRSKPPLQAKIDAAHRIAVATLGAEQAKQVRLDRGRQQRHNNSSDYEEGDDTPQPPTPPPPTPPPIAATGQRVVPFDLVATIQADMDAHAAVRSGRAHPYQRASSSPTIRNLRRPSPRGPSI